MKIKNLMLIAMPLLFSFSLVLSQSITCDKDYYFIYSDDPILAQCQITLPKDITDVNVYPEFVGFKETHNYEYDPNTEYYVDVCDRYNFIGDNPVCIDSHKELRKGKVVKDEYVKEELVRNYDYDLKYNRYGQWLPLTKTSKMEYVPNNPNYLTLLFDPTEDKGKFNVTVTGIFKGSPVKYVLDPFWSTIETSSSCSPLTEFDFNVTWDTNSNTSSEEVVIMEFNDTSGTITDLTNTTLFNHSELIMYWKFDDEALNNTGDSSGNSRHLLLHDGTTYGTGYQGSGLHFANNSSSHGQLSSPFNYNVTSATFSIWASLNDSASGHSILYRGLGNSLYPRIYFSLTSMVAQFRVDGSTRTMTYNSAHGSGWNHYVLTLENNTGGRFYVNGALAVDDNQTGTIFDSGSSRLEFGWDDNLPRYTNGTLDEIRIYNRSLSAEEVRNLYFSGQHVYNYTTTDITTRSIYNWQQFSLDTDGNWNTTGAQEYNYTCCLDANTQILASYDYGGIVSNTSSSGQEALDTFASWLPTLMLVIAGVLVMGVIIRIKM